jgi:hypothetical protein
VAKEKLICLKSKQYLYLVKKFFAKIFPKSSFVSFNAFIFADVYKKLI